MGFKSVYMRWEGKKLVCDIHVGAIPCHLYSPQPIPVSIYHTPITPTPTPINTFFNYIREWFPYYSIFILLGVNAPSVPVYQ